MKCEGSASRYRGTEGSSNPLLVYHEGVKLLMMKAEGEVVTEGGV